MTATLPSAAHDPVDFPADVDSMLSAVSKIIADGIRAGAERDDIKLPDMTPQGGASWADERARNITWALAPYFTVAIELAAALAHRNLHLHFSPLPNGGGFVATVRSLPSDAGGGRILGTAMNESPLSVLRGAIALARSQDS